MSQEADADLAAEEQEREKVFDEFEVLSTPDLSPVPQLFPSAEPAPQS